MTSIKTIYSPVVSILKKQRTYKTNSSKLYRQAASLYGSSNSYELIKRLPGTLREIKDDITFQDEEYKIKALGIVWRPNLDSFVFTVKLADKPPTTKSCAF